MAHRDSDSTEGLLQELLWTYGPCGQEDAVRAVCARELQPVVDDMWIDDAGNLIGYIGAADRPGDDAAVNERRHRSKSTAAPARRRASWHTWTNCPCSSNGSNPTVHCA